MPDYLSLLADLFLACAAIGATIYCLRLGRRLSRFSSIDNGLGGAIAVLSRQVDEMNSALASARTGSAEAEARLDTLLGEARRVSDRLEMLVAGCHDIAAEPGRPTEPEPGPEAAAPAPVPDADPPVPLFSPLTRQGDGTQPLFRHRMPGGR